ncbi:TIGR00282 family metallophosphoesterase [Mycoplasma bovis]|nr:TIGR00282 family metallophosphoesterase [Mycoplasmopsis bovis]
MDNKELKILFIGDIFGTPGIKMVEKHLSKLKSEYAVDVVIAQGENVSGRKGLDQKDYLRLKKAGVDIITLGNHVWAKSDILNIINNPDLVRPANIDAGYPGKGSQIYTLKNGVTLRVTSLMGITFNKLLKPWTQEVANSFFDAIDSIRQYQQKTDFHFIDFHAETTSEKYVLGLYLDGLVDAVCGTHTHVQTNDAHTLPNGTCFISDAGMTGPYNSAIGANFEEVYRHMRFDEKILFATSNNPCQFNGVFLHLNTDKRKNKIVHITILPE